MGLLLAVLAILITRKISQRLVRNEAFTRRVLVLGAGRNADLIRCCLREDPSILLVGFVPLSNAPLSVPADLLLHPDCNLLELGRR